MSGKTARPPRRLPDDFSDFARRAYDVLMGGVTTFELADPGRAETNKWLAENAKHLAELLRSEEPIPRVIRNALADAIDDAEAPICISFKMGRKRPLRLARLLRDHEKARRGLVAYDAAQAAGRDHTYCMQEATTAAGMRQKDLSPLLADLRADRRRAAEVKAAMEAGKSVAEIAELIRLPMKRKRGPTPKSKI